MTLVYAGLCSHAPGITGRAEMIEDTAQRDRLYAAFAQQRSDIEASGAEALIVIAAEHFANFFMNNMPAFCIGTGDVHEGPIEDPDWLKIPKTRIPGSSSLALKITEHVMQSVDVAYAQEWKCDHGIMVPLHFLTPDYQLPVIPVNINCQGPPLTPLSRAWAFGEALRAAADHVPEEIAIIGTGGVSHWPATPDSGKINEAWDREFLDHLVRQDKSALLAYSDTQTYEQAGQGGFEIRTFISAAAAAGAPANIAFYEPIPLFAVGCTIARFELG